MLLHIYIGTVIFSLLSFLGATYAIKRELKLIYTKEQLKQFNKKQGHTSNPVFLIFAILCPITNILLGLVYLFAYDDVRDSTIEKIQNIMGE